MSEKRRKCKVPDPLVRMYGNFTVSNSGIEQRSTPARLRAQRERAKRG
jgi:hypothetical protein